MAFKRKNIAILSNEIGIEIEVIDTEVPTGSFSADILALESGSDKKIIIENQLKKTDHDHLGKIITYASGHDAKTIISVFNEPFLISFFLLFLEFFLHQLYLNHSPLRFQYNHH